MFTKSFKFKITSVITSIYLLHQKYFVSGCNPRFKFIISDPTGMHIYELQHVFQMYKNNKHLHIHKHIVIKRGTLLRNKLYASHAKK